MQASNFGGIFDQLFLRIFYKVFTEDASQPRLYHGAKKSKMTKNSNQGGPALITGTRLVENVSREILLARAGLDKFFLFFFFFFASIYLIVTIIGGYYILRIFAIWKKSQN